GRGPCGSGVADWRRAVRAACSSGVIGFASFVSEASPFVFERAAKAGAPAAIPAAAAPAPRTPTKARLERVLSEIPSLMFPPCLGGFTEHLEAHPRDSPADELQLSSGGVGEVDHAPLDIRPTIVDAHHHGSTIVEVRDLDPASERQGRMRAVKACLS